MDVITDLGTIDMPRAADESIADESVKESAYIRDNAVKHSAFGGMVAAGFFFLVGVLLARSLSKPRKNRKPNRGKDTEHLIS